MMRWYAVLTTPGRENKVRRDILQRLESLSKSRFVQEIVIPTQEVREHKGDEHVVKEQRILPGYLLLKGELREVQSHVKEVRGVRGFVGNDDHPAPMPQSEIDHILGRAGKADKTQVATAFQIGQTVKITDGPLADFTGEVSEVDERSGKITVLVQIFGRVTPTELDWRQVRKES